jgi:hypothetical protein
MENAIQHVIVVKLLIQVETLQKDLSDLTLMPHVNLEKQRLVIIIEISVKCERGVLIASMCRKMVDIL